MAQQASRFERLFALQGKIALITGASGGIGRVRACDLADERLAEAADAIAAAGGRVAHFAANLAEVAACQGLIAEVHKHLANWTFWSIPHRADDCGGWSVSGWRLVGNAGLTVIDGAPATLRLPYTLGIPP